MSSSRSRHPRFQIPQFVVFLHRRVAHPRVTNFTAMLRKIREKNLIMYPDTHIPTLDISMRIIARACQ